MNDHLLAQIKRHEGLVKHAYQDHLGYWTIGYGRLIDEKLGGGLSEDEASFLLRNDIARAYADLLNNHPWVDDLDAAQLPRPVRPVTPAPPHAPGRGGTNSTALAGPWRSARRRRSGPVGRAP